MIVSAPSSISLYKQLSASQDQQTRQKAETAGKGWEPKTDAYHVSGTTQGLSRNLTREQALAGAQPDALTPQYLGPARAADRTEASGLKQQNSLDLNAYFQDLANGCQAGPKPVSALAAEANYLAARKLL